MRHDLVGTTAFVALAALGALALAACDAPTALDGSTSYDPPAVYAAWWKATELCSGLRGGMDGIRWARMPGDAFVDADGVDARGSWHAHERRIYVAARWVDDGLVVRHEMLHALRSENYLDAEHPPEYFRDRCGGVVDCVPVCASPSTAPRRLVLASALEIAVTLGRGETTPLADSGWVSAIVSVRNPGADPVEVLVPAGGTSIGDFWVTLDDAVFFPPLSTVQFRTTRFAAGEVKREVIDLKAGRLAAGSHVVRSHYFDADGATATLVVRR